MRAVIVNLIIFALAAAITGCSAKKIIGRNCEKAGNAELFVCDPL